MLRALFFDYHRSTYHFSIAAGRLTNSRATFGVPTACVAASMAFAYHQDADFAQQHFYQAPAFGYYAAQPPTLMPPTGALPGGPAEASRMSHAAWDACVADNCSTVHPVGRRETTADTPLKPPRIACLRAVPADEVRTVFITGFPEDVKERELNNMLRFLPGYEVGEAAVQRPSPPAAHAAERPHAVPASAADAPLPVCPAPLPSPTGLPDALPQRPGPGLCAVCQRQPGTHRGGRHSEPGV